MELGYEPILHPSNGQGDGLVSLQSGSYLSCLTSFIWCFRISGCWCWFYGIFANFSSKAWRSQGQGWFLSLWETLVRERLHNISMKLVERYDLLLAPTTQYFFCRLLGSQVFQLARSHSFMEWCLLF